MIYKNRITLTNPRGITHTLRAFSSVNISESDSNPIKKSTVNAPFIDNREFMRDHTIGSILQVYTKEAGKEERKLFHGYISTVPRVLDGNVKNYTFEATCLLGKTQTILVNETYENRSVYEVINDLLNSYTNFFKKVEIKAPSIDISMDFKDEYLYDCFNKIAESIGYVFEADEETFKFYKEEPKLNDNVIRKGKFYKGTASFSDDSSQLVNHLRGYGSKELTKDSRTEIFKSNGKTTQYYTEYKPSKTEVYVDDVKQRVGIMYLHEEGYDCYVNYNENLIEFEEPPRQGKDVRIVYKYYQRIIVEETDQNSIEMFGMYSSVEKLEHISDRKTLRAYLKEKLRRYSRPILTGSVSPFYDHWNVRDLVKIHLPEIGVEENLICTGKNTAINPGIVKTSLTFEEKPDLVDVLKNHLDRIRDLERNRDEEEAIDKFRSIEEKIEVVDTQRVVRLDRANTFKIDISAIGEVL